MHRHLGFTVPELLIAVAISGVLLGSAAPGLRGMVLNSRRAAAVNELVTSIQLARADSLKRRGVTTICPSIDGVVCGSSADWSNGWLVYANADQNYSGAEPDAGETVLRYSSNDANGVRIAAAGRSHFSFRAFDINSDNGTFTLCDERGIASPAERRAIIVSTTGRPRVSSTTWDGGSLTCP